MSQTQTYALESTLNQIVAQAAAQIALAVRQNIAHEVARLADVDFPLGHAQKRRTILCPVPGCGQPGGGPKYGWCCGEHKDLPESEKQAARFATRARPSAASAMARRRARS
jgi:hypothetical protein